ncbi:MAG: energy-coupled thiamine transporter ThiT [Oscillospiraceae bacterium]|nr:energy-coupled thiamine transporter ThiT [Oscillospiraceae bacterium]
MKTTVTTHERILRLVTSAVLIGLSTVLSLIKPIQMPLGGSITLLSMLPVCLLSVKYGVKTGLGCAFAYALLQLALDFGSVMSWGLTRKALVACIVIDYLLAFTSLGVAGVFRRKGQAGICVGIALAIFLRFVFHVVSGTFVFDIWCEWDSAWLYSVCYNGAFMLPEMIITVAAAVTMMRFSQVRKLICESPNT